MRFAGPILALLLALVPAMALHAGQDPVQTAHRASQKLKAAARQLDQADHARDRVAALTATVTAYEEGLKSLRESIRRAALRERVIRLRFEARRAQLSRLLGVLMTVQSASPPLLMIHPGGALDTVHAAMMISEVTPSLQTEAEALRKRLEEIHILQAVQNSAAEDLRAGLAGVQAARSVLSQAIAERTDLPRRLIADPERMQTLADNARTLEEFADNLPAAGAPPDGTIQPALRSFKAARGNLPLPVPGRLLHAFNEADAANIRRPGWVLSAPPLSLVTAPAAATIRYLGPLLDYGNVIILEPAADYLLVLAGLDTVYGRIGDILPACAPLGLLGGATPEAGEFMLEAAAHDATTERETLYIEIRHEGMPVDPADWFAQNRE